MRIKLDENLPVVLVTELAALGHDVDSVPGEELASRSDAEIWTAAQRARRFLITQDLDFSDIRQFAPNGATLAELAGAAGLRWTIEECFERDKSDLGLDHCEARSWHGWHRHMTLVMAAAAFLAKLAADLRRSAFSKANETSPTNASAA